MDTAAASKIGVFFCAVSGATNKGALFLRDLWVIDCGDVSVQCRLEDDEWKQVGDRVVDDPDMLT